MRRIREDLHDVRYACRYQRARARPFSFSLHPRINTHSFLSRSVASFETARVRRHAERAKETRERNGSELVQRSWPFPALRARRTMRTYEEGQDERAREEEEEVEKAEEQEKRRRETAQAESRGGTRERRFKGKKEEVTPMEKEHALRERGRERDREEERNTAGGEEGAWRTGRSLRSSAGSSAATGRGDLDVATRAGGASRKSESIRER